ncbi:MAG: DUF262 domain-containing protein [Methylococcales symbiont of Hymedesmia sp. n. MRB-2018]|nr:MAG: DUF262 domain-containing protein [Methylococcales symbiont of Hymedesmia sp. n. MRB-2018]
MSNNNLKSLSEIFNDKNFRIPDYQRGYSWKTEHITDFWRDLKNLTTGKYHYTGMLTISVKSDGNYFVIDGQQRLTTIIILLKNILDKFKDDDWLSEDIQKRNAVDKYLYKTTRNSKNPSEMFGYEKENSSYDFYRMKILEIQNPTKYESTLYTANLLNTNNFFKDKIKKIDKKDLEVLFNKVTHKLKFNLYEIDQTDELDEYVIFETMNNRGKPLSTLEILKNRLIYLVTLLDNDDRDKEIIRRKINTSWKTIYEYLGKKSNKKISEDLFLKTHWLMYWGKSNKNESNPEKSFLLNDFFTLKKVLVGNVNKKKYEELSNNIEYLKKFLTEVGKTSQKNNKQVKKEDLRQDTLKAGEAILHLKKQFSSIGNHTFIDDEEEVDWFTETLLSEPRDTDFILDNIRKVIIDSEIELDKIYLSYDVIDRYVSNIQKSVVSYYETLNPEKSDFSDDVKFWLEKINRIVVDEIKYMPVFLSLFNNSDGVNDKHRVEILKLMENYLFVKKYAKTRSSSQVRQEFYSYPCKFNRDNSIENFNDNLEKVIMNIDQKNKYFDGVQFIEQITNLFKQDKKDGKFGKGFYTWGGLNYLLYEYELYLQQKTKGSVEKILWANINKESIEHILPQTPKGKWLDVINPLKTEKTRNKVIHSIGNLVLMSVSKNSTLSNKSFDKKKEILSNGSYSEIAISKYEIWDIERIKERGINILKFMRNRWKLNITEEQLNKIT